MQDLPPGFHATDLSAGIPARFDALLEGVGESGPPPPPCTRDPVVALAQPAEHRIVDPKVTGSTPVGHPKLDPEEGQVDGVDALVRAASAFGVEVTLARGWAVSAASS